MISKWSVRFYQMAKLVSSWSKDPSTQVGAVITEQIFAYPGVGWLAVQSIYNRDFPVIQAIVMIVSVGVVATNFIIDIVYTIIDPRIRYDKGK